MLSKLLKIVHTFTGIFAYIFLTKPSSLKIWSALYHYQCSCQGNSEYFWTEDHYMCYGLFITIFPIVTIICLIPFCYSPFALLVSWWNLNFEAKLSNQIWSEQSVLQALTVLIFRPNIFVFHQQLSFTEGWSVCCLTNVLFAIMSRKAARCTAGISLSGSELTALSKSISPRQGNWGLYTNYCCLLTGRDGRRGETTSRIGFYRWFGWIMSKSKGKMKRIPGKVFINPWDCMTSIRDC